MVYPTTMKWSKALVAVTGAVVFGLSGTASAGFAAVGTAAAGTVAAAPAGTLSETGSSLLYPLFTTWAKAYHRADPGVRITTASTGSGEGIDDAASGKADIGASDAYLSSGDLVDNPALLNIPVAISAQQINYNLPSLPATAHVKLNGTVLAEMYSGQIKRWNAPAIAALNPGLHLPALWVVPVHRQDSAGDTFLFSSYLATGDPGWNARIGYGTTVAWPHTPGATAATGNTGMVQACAAKPGCVAYIGISYLSEASADHLDYAALENAAGRYVLPDAKSIAAAAAVFVSQLPPNETISMVNGPAADGYPIVNYEYVIVSTHPKGGGAGAIRQFLNWAVTKGNAASYLGPVHFEPLPAEAVSLAQAQVKRIGA